MSETPRTHRECTGDVADPRTPTIVADVFFRRGFSGDAIGRQSSRMPPDHTTTSDVIKPKSDSKKEMHQNRHFPTTVQYNSNHFQTSHESCGGKRMNTIDFASQFRTKVAKRELETVVWYMGILFS